VATHCGEMTACGEVRRALSGNAAPLGLGERFWGFGNLELASQATRSSSLCDFGI
jgi:hypothetical protein